LKSLKIEIFLSPRNRRAMRFETRVTTQPKSPSEIAEQNRSWKSPV